MTNEQREQIRQKARKYRKQFYAPGTQHVNDSSIDQENMLTGFVIFFLSGGLLWRGVPLSLPRGQLRRRASETTEMWLHI